MTQRDKMRQLFQLHGEGGMEEILRQYAKAERSGEVQRKKKGVLTTEEYAVLLYKDGIKKGWIREQTSSSSSQASTKRACGVLQEHGSTTGDKQIPTSDLTPDLLPEDRAPWPAILRFAYSFDGYDYWAGLEKCGKIGNAVRERYGDTGDFQSSIDILRTALFFEARRFHDDVLDQESLEYIWAVISEIRRLLP